MKIKYLTLIIAAITPLVFLSGCSPKMEIPSYIWIDSVDFRITDEVKQGTASHKITDVWISANGANLGMYQLPARIPVLADGATRLSIGAGIMLGGIPQIRRAYPFYTSYDLTATLKKGKIDTIRPHFTYIDNAQFYLIEDFESAGFRFSAVGKSAPLNKTSDETLLFHHPKEDNNYSGILELPYTNDSATVHHFEIRTLNPVNLTYLTAYYCLMELNFCITHDVEIGMIAHSANPALPDRQIPLANLAGVSNPKTDKPVWKKVYVNFSSEIGEESKYQMVNFDIYIRSTIAIGEEARYLFDNIKVVYN